MQVSSETLRTTIGALSDEELLRRWGVSLFTDDALPVAESELKRRGLDYSAENIERVAAFTASEISVARSVRYVQLLTGLVTAFVAYGFVIGLGLIGGLVGGAIALPLGRSAAVVIDRKFRSSWARFLAGLCLALVSLLLAGFISVFLGILLETRA